MMEGLMMSKKTGFLGTAVSVLISVLLWNGGPARAQQDKSVTLDGIWRLRGYGKMLHICQGNYTNYDVTAISCLPVSKGTVRDLMERFDRFALHDHNQLSLFSKGGDTRYTYDRLESLPENCRDRSSSGSRDPEFNFEVFYRSFKENYPFFKLHGLDWEGMYKTYRPRVTAKTTEDELFDIFSANIKSFNDPHVSLLAGDRWVGNMKPDNLALHNQQEFASEEPGNRFFKSLEKLRSVMQRDFLAVDSHVGGNGFVVWGKIKPNIGYLNFFVMGDFAGFGASRTESEAVLQKILDQVMEDFRNVQAVVVDVRFNTGGHDRISMMIADRFADRERLAFRTKAVFGGGFTEEQEFHVHPEGNFQFTGPTFLLTSERTVSAGESLVLYMMACPHVTRVGGTTAGTFSNALTMHLPNGWEFEMSNEVWTAADGRVYEGIGIPPQVEVPVFIPGNIYPGLKLAVDKAVLLAEKAIASSAAAAQESRPAVAGATARGNLFSAFLFGDTELGRRWAVLRPEAERTFPALKLKAVADLHVTFVYIGADWRDQDLPRLRQAMRGAAPAAVMPLRAELTRFGRNGRVVAVELTGAPETFLARVAALKSELNAAGLKKPEAYDSDYRPHVTLAEARESPPSEDQARQLEAFRAWAAGRLDPSTLGLSLGPSLPLRLLLADADRPALLPEYIPVESFLEKGQ
jgi:carboxyl-terminal processing protease